ncbi:MAG: CoA-binding protein [Gluconacetobacter diazotrophicus]|nr:CoA-binding protein [Gluconacetobacter diazotrophicus]
MARTGERADGLDDRAVADLLLRTRRIAVVGASAKPERPSYGVTAFLVRQGYEVVPVNPGLAGQTVHGRTVVASLDEAGPLDMVDVFRRPAEVAGVVDEAIRLGARSVWLQLGLVDRPAADRAREAGLAVAMDRCPAIEWPRLGLAALPDRTNSPATA